MPDFSTASTTISQESKKFVTWLHLSDWHQGRPDFDRTVLLEQMLKCIRNRVQIDPRLSQIQLVVFSGDIAFSGQKDEYSAAQAGLIEPLREMLGADVRFIFAPGNHDMDRLSISEDSPPWEKQIALGGGNRQKRVSDLFFDPKKGPVLLTPFDNFYGFSSANGCCYPPGKFIFAHLMADSGVGFVAINTALCCSRNSLKSRFGGEEQSYWDYGVLSITERQILQALDQVKGARIKILVMHHPISWMHASEQPLLEQLIASNFDLVLYGHEHLPRFSSVSGNFGDIKFVPAGSAYAGRLQEDPRHTNAFNFGLIDLESDEGAIFHQRWIEEKHRWYKDERYWPEGIARFLLQKNFVQDNVKYIFDAHRRYRSYHSKRASRRAEISLKHEAIKVDGQSLIEATVRYKIHLYPGLPETYFFETIKNKRIESHPSAEIRRLAFTPILMLPKPSSVATESESKKKIEGEVELTTDAATIEYHYKFLECEDGIWFFQLGRFTDKVKIEIQKAEGYDYEFAPVGGFPERLPGPDSFWSFDSLESDGGHLPGQGYLVQWYRR